MVIKCGSKEQLSSNDSQTLMLQTKELNHIILYLQMFYGRRVFIQCSACTQCVIVASGDRQKRNKIIHILDMPLRNSSGKEFEVSKQTDP